MLNTSSDIMHCENAVQSMKKQSCIAAKGTFDLPVQYHKEQKENMKETDKVFLTMDLLVGNNSVNQAKVPDTPHSVSGSLCPCHL